MKWHKDLKFGTMRSCQSLTLAVSLKLDYFGNYTENDYAIYHQFHSMHQNKFSRVAWRFLQIFLEGANDSANLRYIKT